MLKTNEVFLPYSYLESQRTSRKIFREMSGLDTLGMKAWNNTKNISDFLLNKVVRFVLVFVMLETKKVTLCPTH